MTKGSFLLGLPSEAGSVVKDHVLQGMSKFPLYSMIPSLRNFMKKLTDDRVGPTNFASVS